MVNRYGKHSIEHAFMLIIVNIQKYSKGLGPHDTQNCDHTTRVFFRSLFTSNTFFVCYIYMNIFEGSILKQRRLNLSSYNYELFSVEKRTVITRCRHFSGVYSDGRILSLFS